MGVKFLGASMAWAWGCGGCIGWLLWYLANRLWFGLGVFSIVCSRVSGVGSVRTCGKEK